MRRDGWRLSVSPEHCLDFAVSAGEGGGGGGGGAESGSATFRKLS